MGYRRSELCEDGCVLLKDGLVDGIDVAARDHAVYTDAEAISAVEGEATLVLTGVLTATSPVLTTPALGTPSALVGTNITGTASGLTAGNVTTNANLTGHVTSVGNATVLGSFTVAQLNTAISDATVVDTSDIGVSVQAFDATILVDADIGVNVQAWDADLDALAGIGTAISGDIIFASAAGVWSRLAKGSDTDVLTLAAGLPSWAVQGAPGAHATSHENGGGDEISVLGLSGLLADDQHVLDAEVTAVAISNTLMTTRGDIIFRNATVPARLAKGALGTVLTMGADGPEWAAAAGFQFATGEYTGDGATSQAITGLGFAPKFVHTHAKDETFNSTNVHYTWDDLVNDSASGVDILIGTSAQTYIDGIISLDSDGFTVDDRAADQDPNKNTIVYKFYAWA